MAKKQKTKFPKKIAGIRLPKRVRKSLARLIDWGASAEGQRVLGAGVTALVAATATRAAPQPRPGEPRDTVDPLARLQPLMGIVAAATGALMHAKDSPKGEDKPADDTGGPAPRTH